MKISDYAQKRYIILNKIVKYSKIKTKFKMKKPTEAGETKGERRNSPGHWRLWRPMKEILTMSRSSSR